MPPQRPKIADVKKKVDLLERRLQQTWISTGILALVVGYLIFSG